MRPFGSNSRGPSSEFERISLDELPRPDTRPELRIAPPEETNPPIPTSLSPSRSIVLPRVSLRRQNTSNFSSHWRRPSYSRVGLSSNTKDESSSPERPYDEEGGVEPDMREVEEGLKDALGTSADLGSWLPMTRAPTIRRTEQSPATPQIVVEDTAAEETVDTDERETAALTENASQIAGAPSPKRAKTLSPKRPRIITSGLLGSDLSALERRGSAPDTQVSPTSPTSGDIERILSPGGNTVIRHLRKVSQRVVNIAHTDEQAEEVTSFAFSPVSPKTRPSISESPHEFPFPSSSGPASPTGKLSAEFDANETAHSRWVETVELRGKSLGLFGPKNAFRNWLCDVLLHPATEPTIFVLIIAQTVFLTIQSAPDVESSPGTLKWGRSWVDYAIFSVFVLYTIELCMKIIVSGFIINPPAPLQRYHNSIKRRPTVAGMQDSKQRSRSKSPKRKDTLKRQYSTSAVRQAESLSGSQPLSSTSTTANLRRQYSTSHTLSPGSLPGRGRRPTYQSHLQPEGPSQQLVTEQQEQSQQPPNYPVPILSAATFYKTGQDEAQLYRNRHKARLAQCAYLRHSFNRMDFIAIVSYWIALLLELTGIVSKHHIFIFKMLSCLRIFRLLGITEGTTTILRGLKKAAPLLVQVAFFVLFFWVIFAIIGIQTFRGSFRRQCVWVDPLQVQSNFTQMFQFCGGYLDPIDYSPRPYITANGAPSTEDPKGFLCPVQSLCVESSNPYNGTVSFDNIAQSMELVFVIISANTFTDLMYYAIDAEYLVAAVFFVIAIVFLTFWLVNLVIAVITSSFQITREESHRSAFTSKRQQSLLKVEEENPVNQRPISRAQHWYNQTKFVWVILIAIDLTIQSFRTASMRTTSKELLDLSETIATVIFVAEIVLREKTNYVDVFLAASTGIIQIPIIHSSGSYGWLTIFQIMRVYRVIVALPITRNLLSQVLSNVYGLLNLIMFLFLMTFLVAILACQLVRGDIPTVDQYGNQYEMSFRTVWNAFLGMYQIVSSENWTQILYAATMFQSQYDIAWISAIFFIAWYMVGNNVVVSMFIAMIQENIGVTEEEKRKEQVRAFIEKAVPTLANTEIHGNLTLASVFRKKRKEPLLESGPETYNLLLKEAIVKEFLDEQEQNKPPPKTLQQQHEQDQKEPKSTLNRIVTWFTGTKVHKTFGESFNIYSNQNFSIINLPINPNTVAKDALVAHARQRAQQADFLKSNPDVNKSLWIFTADSPIRRLCQSIVAPSRGERLEGVDPNPIAWWCFSVLTYIAIICIVVLACITTPLYELEYFARNGESKFNWITWTDIAFSVIFSVEAIIKIIADGFLFTPNAYIRNIWNDLDFFVLLTLWINVLADLTDRGGISRAFRAFKALRALRLVNISETARQTFHDVIISGFWNILSAALVAMSLLIPYAIWGLNIFNGLFFFCNDSTQTITKATCVGEYNSSPQNWNVWAARSWANPQFYNFDDFGSSLSTLFEIVSQEGWINVLTSAMAIVGLDQNPRMDASPGNAFFFVTFNILGAVFVMTLFVSVIITSYTKRSGLAYMTADQRSWQELRKVLLQLRPSRRPTERPDQSWRAWCYDRAISKHGFWTRFMTAVYTVHVILLMLEMYPQSTSYNLAQNLAFLTLSLIYIVNITIRMVGLGMYHYFRSKWDVYEMVIVIGTIATTLAVVAKAQSNAFVQFQKLFLVAVAFNLIPKSDALDQLFKTAVSSLPTIASLLSIWLVLFIVYAIAFTQIFGLTRLGPNGTGTLNFRTIPNALIVLFRMSLGEGWDQIMKDYTVSSPHCVSNRDFFLTDCGSPAWAYGLFISWNILSMYIFANMLLTVVYENFSYVYQRAGKLRLFSRDEIRRFKKTWAKFDKYATGYIQKEQLARFLSQLRGIFEVRIYDDSQSVRAILEQCKREVDPTETPSEAPAEVADLDLQFLSHCINQFPVEEIRERRRNFNILYEEAMMSADERGISFTAMLLMLAHYKIIDDNKALSLDEFLRRRAKRVRVTDQVNEKICRGVFQTLYWRRWFLQQRSTSASYPGMVPAIIVEEPEPTSLPGPRPALPSLDLTQMRNDMGTGYSPTSPTFGQESLQVRHSPQSDGEDESSSRLRTWSNIGGPESQIASSAVQSELSQPISEEEAMQVVQSLGESVWGGAFRGNPHGASKGPDRSGESDVQE